MNDTPKALPPHSSHDTVRDWMPVAEALRLADLWTVGDLDNRGQWRAAIKVLADEVRAALAQRQPTDNTEALPPLPKEFGRVLAHTAAYSTGGYCAEVQVEHMSHLHGRVFTDVQMKDYARAALAQRQQVPAITDAMVDAYLQANDAYWREVDALATDLTKPWRQGTPKEATRVSLAAALTAAPSAQAEPTRSQKMREAGFTARDNRLTCDECGAKFTAQFAPLHKCETPAAQSEPQVPLTDEQIDGLRGLDTASRVRFYEHDFYVLSNFSAFTLIWKGIRFDTSEAAYHWEKFTGDSGSAQLTRHFIQTAPSAHEAFKIAEWNKEHRRPDWDEVKVEIMLDILREKAKQHEYVRRKLLATGDRELVEDSWRDDFWGWGPNRDGRNMLGKLWMQVRAELRGIGKQEGKL